MPWVFHCKSATEAHGDVIGFIQAALNAAPRELLPATAIDGRSLSDIPNAFSAEGALN
jgi:hypothetical protein